MHNAHVYDRADEDDLMITSTMIMVMIIIRADNDGVFDLECSPEDRLSV